MKEKTILNKLKVLLGMEVKLEQMKLADGITVIQADSFEPEMEVMIVTTDEQMIPLPIGEYELEDGRKLTVVVSIIDLGSLAGAVGSVLASTGVSTGSITSSSSSRLRWPFQGGLPS